MSDKKTKLDVVAGFLGAGKTTLINKFLAEAFVGERVAILENELGEIGVDGDLLPHALAVRELLNGCICCTLQGDFVNGIKELAAVYKPDRIIIEPTGVGNLKDVLDACRIAEQQAAVQLETALTVVNAPLMLIYLSACGEFYKDQIRYSPLVVLSQTQKLKDPGPNLDGIQTEIRKLNPRASIIAESWNKLDSMEILTVAETATVRLNGGPEHHGHGHHHAHDHDHEGGFETCSFILKDNWKTEDLERFAAGLKENHYGEVFRAKGFIPFAEGFRKFDYVYGNEETTPSGYCGQGKIVVIGKKLNRENLATCLA
jgi:G3E family GTPase